MENEQFADLESKDGMEYKQSQRLSEGAEERKTIDCETTQPRRDDKEQASAARRGGALDRFVNGRVNLAVRASSHYDTDDAKHFFRSTAVPISVENLSIIQESDAKMI